MIGQVVTLLRPRRSVGMIRELEVPNSIPPEEERTVSQFVAQRTVALRRLDLVLAVVALLSVLSCGGGDAGAGSVQPPPPPPPPVPTATTISLSVTADTLRALAATTTILATIRDQFGSVMPSAPAPSWASSAGTVASVAGGVVTAVSKGAATITASSGTLSAAAQIQVEQRPATMIRVAGDGQDADVNTQLGAALAVRVQDSGGSNIAGATVEWLVASGGGVLSLVQVSTDGSGAASARWTLGPSSGTQSVTASAGPGATTSFSATASVPPFGLTISAIQPATLEEGQQATVTGSGLQGTSVLLGITPATVVTSSPNSLTFVVPVSQCQPSRTELVRVRRGTDEVSRSAAVRPANRIQPMVFGSMWMHLGGVAEGHCLHLEGQGAQVRYLIGVQSLSQSATSLTPSSLRISGATAAFQDVAAGAVGTAATTEAIPGLEWRNLGVTPVASEARMANTFQTTWSAPPNDEIRRSRAHAEHTDRNLDLLRRLRSPSRVASSFARVTTAAPVVGEQIALKVPSGCDTFVPITGTVKVVGTRSVWIEDNARPSGGFTNAQYTQLAATYDGTIGLELERYLGPATDVDVNGRVVIVVTPEMNKHESFIGVVWSSDFYPKSLCPSSNFGEYFYVLAPDPNGVTPRPKSVSALMQLFPSLMAHEMTHVLHFGTQLSIPRNSEFPVTWEMEGIATFMEQLVGHAFTGRGSGQNLGSSVVAQNPDWYRNMINDLAYYFGYQSPTSRVLAAPHDCSWLGRPPNGTCLSDARLPYGVPASVFRWIADYAWMPATEAQMTRAVMNSTVHGLPILANLASEELHWVMAYWAVALAADDVYFGSGGPTFSSWNLGDIFANLTSTARLSPTQAAYAFQSQFNVRGGSVAYFTVAGPHAEVAISAANLPSTMRLWIVRVQ